MIFLLGILEGLRQLWVHKVRSLLSIACVSLGVSSFVIVSGLITGMFSGWEASITSIGGSNKVSVLSEKLPPEQRHLAGSARGRTMDDADALKKMASFALYVSPEIDLSGARLSRGTREYELRIQGVENSILRINNYSVASGTFFTALDQSQRERVIVIGSTVVKELFDSNEDPVDQILKVNGHAFQVIGVLEHYEQMQFGYNVLDRKNRIAFIPIRTMTQLFKPSAELTWLNLLAANSETLPKLVDQTRNIMTQMHGGLRDFRVKTNAENYAEFEKTRQSWLVGGAAVAVVSLLVGGIGIMNLMLASIQERLREIGVRKAVGAMNRDIFVLFLAEAVTLSMIGGAGGIGLGWLILTGLSGASANFGVPEFSLVTGLVGFLFSAATGVVAGLYPAIEASRMDPIEALRTE